MDQRLFSSIHFGTKHADGALEYKRDRRIPVALQHDDLAVVIATDVGDGRQRSSGGQAEACEKLNSFKFGPRAHLAFAPWIPRIRVEFSAGCVVLV